MNSPEERLEGDHWAIVGCAARTSDSCNAGDGHLELFPFIASYISTSFCKSIFIRSTTVMWYHMLLVPSTITPWKASLEVPLGVPSCLVAGMTPHTSIFFFSFATVKSVDVHRRLWLPGNPVHLIFHNTAYHDIHHQLSSKYSYSQPFFVTWDKLLGTSIPFVLQKRADGGFEARPLRPYVKMEATTMKTE